MFVFRFNFRGKLRFMVSSAQNVLFTFSQIMNKNNIWIWSLGTKLRKYGILFWLFLLIVPYFCLFANCVFKTLAYLIPCDWTYLTFIRLMLSGFWTLKAGATYDLSFVQGANWLHSYVSITWNAHLWFTWEEMLLRLRHTSLLWQAVYFFIQQLIHKFSFFPKNINQMYVMCYEV